MSHIPQFSPGPLGGGGSFLNQKSITTATVVFEHLGNDFLAGHVFGSLGLCTFSFVAAAMLNRMYASYPFLGIVDAA
jgi:hypothetical protein